MEQNGKLNTLLQASTLDLKIPKDGFRSWLRLGPIPHTSGQTVAITIELQEEIPSQIRLHWIRHKTKDDDAYSDGSALLDRKAIEADLYFKVY